MLLRAFLAAVLVASCSPKQATEPTPVAQVQQQQCVKPQIVLHKPGLAPNPTYYSDSAPPERFRGDNHAEVEFVSPDEVTRRCGNGPPICGMRILACEQDGKIIMPNPCGAITEFYGRLLCHELGHINKWPATHGD